MSEAGKHGLSDMKTEFVTANVCPSETETNGDTLIFCSHPNLNVGDKKYDFKTLKQEYDYLSILPDIEISMKDVKFIFGQDAYHLIRPLEYKSGKRANRGWLKLLWDGLLAELFRRRKQVTYQSLGTFP